MPPSGVRDFWQRTVGRAINAVDLRIEDEGRFEASLRQRRFGDLRLSHIDVRGTQVVRRTRGDIAHGQGGMVSVIHLLRGQGWLRQCGREVEFGSDRCVLVDSREPYEMAIFGRGESISVHMPGDWLRAQLKGVRPVVAAPYPSTSPWVSRLLDLMNTACSTASLPAASPEVLVRHFGTVFALAVASASEELPPHGPYDAAHQALEELASSPRLRAEEVAGFLGISVRQFHQVFASQGTTFRRELMELRLGRARQMLLDPRFRSLSVEEIARRCGFSDLRHFRRRFSQHFAVSPAALRP